MTFAGGHAWVLLLLLVVPLAAWRLFSRHKPAIHFTSPGLQSMDPTWRQRSRWLLPAFRLMALMLLVAALARPQQGLSQHTADAEGIAIQLVLDRSGSMDHDDFRSGGRWVMRLAAVKDVAGRFVAGGGRLAGRVSDLVGLVTFAQFADSDCPLTLDHEFLLARLHRAQIVEAFREDGTAIGDALGLAVARLHDLDGRRTEPDDTEAIAKVAILLTDGENNAGQLEPEKAAQLAAALNVRVYTIGVGTGGDARSGDAAAGESVLRRVAEITGGKSYRASDTASLEAIYEEIDKLERTRFADRRYTDYRELAIESSRVGPFLFPPLVLAALMLLVLQVTLEQTLYRTIP